jgi:hypothetical protein
VTDYGLPYHPILHSIHFPANFYSLCSLILKQVDNFIAKYKASEKELTEVETRPYPTPNYEFYITKRGTSANGFRVFTKALHLSNAYLIVAIGFHIREGILGYPKNL